ncbi:MAG: putative glycoside hydrolase [Actinomycetota bacterium]
MRTKLRRRTMLAFVALALPLVGGVQAAGGRVTTAPAPSTGALRICSGCANYLNTPGRYSYVVLHSWEAGRIPALKAANPAIKVLLYKDAAASVSYACHNGVDDAKLPAGVGYCWANANHPDWFLADTTGARIEFCDFAGAWQMDVGSAAYQQQWLDNVLADLHSAAWDGVMLDDVNQSETWHLCGRTMARYPAATYAAATESFLARVGPGLHNAGYLAMPNIALDDWWTQEGLSRWDRWVSYSSGAVQEYFSKWGHGTGRWLTDDGTHNDWSGRQALFTRTEGAGKPFVGITYAPSDDVQSMRYARASFLLDWDGGSSALVFEPTTPEAQDPYFAEWATDLGTPTESRLKIGVVWKRAYTSGIVVLNPSPSSTQTVDLGASYILPNGSTGSTVTVGPIQAVVLMAAAPVPPPPPPAAPANTSLPTISATRRGAVLVASTGTWTGNPTSFGYQWLRCDSSGNVCASLAGATANNYTLTTADIGSRLRVAVTARNGGGSATANSSPTNVVMSVKGRLRAFAFTIATPRASLGHARVVVRLQVHLAGASR